MRKEGWGWVDFVDTVDRPTMWIFTIVVVEARDGVAMEPWDVRRRTVVAGPDGWADKARITVDTAEVPEALAAVVVVQSLAMVPVVAVGIAAAAAERKMAPEAAVEAPTTQARIR